MNAISLVDSAWFMVRLFVGVVFVGHGMRKLSRAFGGQGLEASGEQFRLMGFRRGEMMAAIAGSSEVVGGCLLVLGLVTPLAASSIMGVMLAAIWYVNSSNGFWVSDNGIEFPLLVIVLLFAVTLAGPGRVSVDALLEFPWDGGWWWAGGALALSSLGTLVVSAVARSKA